MKRNPTTEDRMIPRIAFGIAGTLVLVAALAGVLSRPDPGVGPVPEVVARAERPGWLVKEVVVRAEAPIHLAGSGRPETFPDLVLSTGNPKPTNLN
jgi:hypothetical protein